MVNKITDKKGNILKIIITVVGINYYICSAIYATCDTTSDTLKCLYRGDIT